MHRPLSEIEADLARLRDEYSNAKTAQVDEHNTRLKDLEGQYFRVDYVDGKGFELCRVDRVVPMQDLPYHCIHGTQLVWNTEGGSLSLSIDTEYRYDYLYSAEEFINGRVRVDKAEFDHVHSVAVGSLELFRSEMETIAH